MQKQQQDLPEQVPEDSNIEDFIEILEEHRQTCENACKYVEAEMAKNRIAELKEKLKSDKLDELKLSQHNECLELEETHILEFNNFN